MTAPVDLDKLDRLRAWATQGKLYMDPYHHSDGSISYDLSIGASASLGTITEPSNLDKPEKGNRKSLAELIVALVNAYPALTAELRELRAKVAELTAMNMGLEQMLDEAEPIMQTRGPRALLTDE